jgi:hypothetical protein
VDDICVMCGRYVPEGTQVCNICKAEVESGAYKQYHYKKPKSIIIRILDKLFRGD